MKQDRICACLEDPEFESIIGSLEYFHFGAGEVIVNQGDPGSHFFVTQEGRLEVSRDGGAVNTLGPGVAFGALALLHNCPRSATVTAVEASGVWGANGNAVKTAVHDAAQRAYSETQRLLDSVPMLDGLSPKQKSFLGERVFTEIVNEGSRVVTEGEAATAMYFVKKGVLSVLGGAVVQSNGEVTGGTLLRRLWPGDNFDVTEVLHTLRRNCTVVAEQRSELFCIGVDSFREVLGENFVECLERAFVLTCMARAPVLSQFSATQQRQVYHTMASKSYCAGSTVDEGGVLFCLVMDGGLVPSELQSSGDLAVNSAVSDDSDRGEAVPNLSRGEFWQRLDVDLDEDGAAGDRYRAGPEGCRVAVLSKDGLTRVMEELGMAAAIDGSPEQAVCSTRKMAMMRKVPIFRHLSEEQIKDLVRSMATMRYRRGAVIIRQGEQGSSFYVLVAGDLKVCINGKHVRDLGKNAYFGERALLFEEPRSATVEVASSEAELWCIERANFAIVVKGMMQEELVHRIRLQDTSVTLKDLRPIRVVGAGGAGVVRLVEHRRSGMRYALKRVRKTSDAVPEEVVRECALLAANDHPFVMQLVKTFESETSVYILTEILIGGELHAAMRKLPTSLPRAQAQFYVGSLLLVLESLHDRHIVYRDLKPENVMLDAQGYLKLIDFGIAKKLDEDQSWTCTVIGTPHYLAPEVIRKKPYGTEVDMWSLGVLLFELVCGFLPFGGSLEASIEVCMAVLKEPLVFPPHYKDAAGKKCIQGLLTRAPKKRLGSGINGIEEIKRSEFFTLSSGDLFQKIMGREMEPPYTPEGEEYGAQEGCDPEEKLSDDDLFEAEPAGQP